MLCSQNQVIESVLQVFTITQSLKLQSWSISKGSTSDISSTARERSKVHEEFMDDWPNFFTRQTHQGVHMIYRGEVNIRMGKEFMAQFVLWMCSMCRWFYSLFFFLWGGWIKGEKHCSRNPIYRIQHKIVKPAFPKQWEYL